jgi:hypothetical protein
MRRRRLPEPRLLACAALLSLACASEGSRAPHPGIAELWRDYRAMPHQRALVLAGDPDRVWVGGASGGHASRSEAKESALAECMQRRAQRRLQAPCRVYAVGDEIVWESW